MLKRKTLNAELQEGAVKKTVNRLMEERRAVSNAAKTGGWSGFVAGALGGILGSQFFHSRHGVLITLGSIGLGTMLGALATKKLAHSRAKEYAEKVAEALTKEYYYGNTALSERIRDMFLDFHNGYVGVDRKGRIFCRQTRYGFRLAIPVRDILDRVYLARSRYHS